MLDRQPEVSLTDSQTARHPVTQTVRESVKVNQNQSERQTDSHTDS